MAEDRLYVCSRYVEYCSLIHTIQLKYTFYVTQSWVLPPSLQDVWCALAGVTLDCWMSLKHQKGWRTHIGWNLNRSNLCTTYLLHLRSDSSFLPKSLQTFQPCNLLLRLIWKLRKVKNWTGLGVGLCQTLPGLIFLMFATFLFLFTAFCSKDVGSTVHNSITRLIDPYEHYYFVWLAPSRLNLLRLMHCLQHLPTSSCFKNY